MQKQHGRFGLILRRGRDLTLYCQIGQESFDFGRAHFTGMTFAVKQDKTPRPIHIDAFSPNGIMLDTDALAHLVQQFWWIRRVGRVRRRKCYPQRFRRSKSKDQAVIDESFA